MKFFKTLVHKAVNMGMIFRVHGPVDKLVIAVTYLKLLLKYAILVNLFRLKLRSEKIFGFRVNFFEYWTFLYLFEEIFVKNEYFFKADNNSPVIIDCGSNIGMSVLYFKKLYPQCEITAFEPDPKTFNVLKENVETNKLKNVEVFNNALSDKKKNLKFYYDPKESGLLTMSANKERMSKAFNVVTALPLSGFIKAKVDFLKMDIEGSEAKVIKELESKKKFSFIRAIALEYHHHLEKKEDALAAQLSILEKNAFGYQISTDFKPPIPNGSFQDVMVFAYKKRSN